MKITIGDLKKIYDPSIENEKWYINDHTILFKDGIWHMFGITHQEPGSPLEEILCAHAITDDLLNVPLKKMPYPLIADKKYGESHFWAPHIVEKDGIYYMFYCGGSLVGNDQYIINLAMSKDLYNWERYSKNPIIIDGFDARDPMIFRYNNKWILYYTCTETPMGGYHMVKALESDDLLNWSNERVVFKSDIKGTIAGPCESPFVIEMYGKYYLFIGPYGGYDVAYFDTAIYESSNPLEFKKENLVTRIPTHASEIIKIDDKYYVTHCGWGMGGLYIAPIYFE